MDRGKMKVIKWIIFFCLIVNSCEMAGTKPPDREEIPDQVTPILKSYGEEFSFYSYFVPFSETALCMGYSSEKNSFTSKISENYSFKLVTNEKITLALSNRRIRSKRDLFDSIGVLKEEDCGKIIGKDASDQLDQLMFDDSHMVFLHVYYHIGNKLSIMNIFLTEEEKEQFSDEEKFRQEYGDLVCVDVVSGFISLRINVYSLSEKINPGERYRIMEQINRIESEGIARTEEEIEEIRSGFMVPGVTKHEIVLSTIPEVPEDGINSIEEYNHFIKETFSGGKSDESICSVLEYGFRRFFF